MGYMPSRIDGIKELESKFRALGKVPMSVVSPAAKKGIRMVQKASKADAPELTGALKKGMILKGEKSRFKGKKVYQVTMDASMNDIFQKAHPAGKYNSKVRARGKLKYGKKLRIGEATTSYYPASQEYGFMTVDGGYVPGLYFMRDALVNQKSAVERVIVVEMKKGIDKILARG